MDPIRFGLAVRALRRRRRWTQAQLAERCDLSRSAVSRIETGEADHFTVAVLSRVVAALGARVSVRVLAHGEDLDRLLDAGHASLVERVAALLRSLGWEVVPEATFSIYGERGSIDVLAFHRQTGALLVIEVKSVIPDVQGTLSGLDRKARLAPAVARELGWSVFSVSRWLVVPDDTTTRRRVAQHVATFAAALPARTVALRRWARSPRNAVAGIMFLPDVNQAGSRHRVRPRTGRIPARREPGAQTRAQAR